MATGLGYATKAAWRMAGPATAWGSIVQATCGSYHKIPYKSESLSENYGWLNQDVLDGSQGRSTMNHVSILPNGNLELQGSYLGLGPIIACCMGYERVRSLTILESPDYYAVTTGTASGGAAGTLIDTGAGWVVNAYAGMYVRNEELAASDNSGNIGVRRIVSNTEDTLTVTPDWTTAPDNGDSYTIGAVFAHQYEMAKNMHQELASDIITTEDAWKNAAYITRVGTLLIDKGVQVWEWERCMVESIEFKLNQDGLMVTAELIPYLRDITPGVTDSSVWKYHALQDTAYAGGIILKPNRVLRGDATFTIGDFSTSSDGRAALGISEFTLKIKNNLDTETQTTATGKYRAEPVRNGKREVTGSLAVPRYTSTTLQGKLAAGTMQMAGLSFVGPEISTPGADTEVLLIQMRSFLLEKGESPVSGAQALDEKYNFKCFAPDGNPSGFLSESAGSDNSEVIILNTNADPFNAFMGQDTTT